MVPSKGSGIKNTLTMPSQWFQMYDDFITKNAHQVSQIESTLRSLTYIIPGTLPILLPSINQAIGDPNLDRH